LACAFAGVLASGIVSAPLSLHALLLAAIAWVYVGFALLDGRQGNVALEGFVAFAFLALALLSLIYSPYLIAAGFVAHGLWDLIHHSRAVTTSVPTWYPRFCAMYDFAYAGLFVVLGLGT
jgi:hypothetical protein